MRGKIARMIKERDLLHRTHSHPGGFTLVELMVTLAVVAILVAIGAPQLAAFVNKQQVRADMNNLISAIHLARSEAMKRSGVVTICPLASATATPPACATNPGKTAWSNGWMVFIDNQPIGVFGSNDTPLKVEQGSRTGQITVAGNAIVSSISFQPIGISTSDMGSFTIGSGNCKLTLSKQGRATTSNCT